MTEAELAQEKRLAHEREVATEVSGRGTDSARTSALTVALAWVAVGLPLAWCVYKTLQSAGRFFH